MHDRRSFLSFRRLLARVRDVMMTSGDAAARLAGVVDVIADEMDTEVCSIYVRRAGEVLELFATKGLLPTAVHQTRLRFGEGLIGAIAAMARPLASNDAQNHPRFVYRPETGEDNFHSLCGVPIATHGRVLGVLAVQSTESRDYDDLDIELLQTVAMVLAELLAGGLIGKGELAATVVDALKPLRLDGLTLNTGLAVGVACLHRPHIPVRRFVADDCRREHERLRQAVADMHGVFDVALDGLSALGQREYRDVLECFRMIAADGGWLRRIGEAIDTGLTAEAAVVRVADDLRDRFRNVADPLLTERFADIEDLTSHLLRRLLGDAIAKPELPADTDVILVARTLGPAELLNYDTRRLRGIVLEEGSPLAHVTIVARALDIPAIGQARNALLHIDAGDPLIIDGDHSQVFVRPADEVRQACENSLDLRAAQRAARAAERGLAAETRDGVLISLQINAGLLIDMSHLDHCGADGVGLYRTEIPFMMRRELPDVDTQTRLYRRVLEYAGDKPVSFRTLDTGGDKLLPYGMRILEENPAMGWRAIRVSLDRPMLLRHQLRAMIRAAAGRSLRVMFPMVASVAEFKAVRKLFEMEFDAAAMRAGLLPNDIRIGAMLEVPSLILELERLLPLVDFVSVGSNDLVQFLFASDRDNARVAERYDPLNPAFLNLLRRIVAQCAEASVPVCLCGEMASRPVDAMALIGIGFRSLSMPPSTVGAVKMMVRSVALLPLQAVIDTLLDKSSAHLRGTLVAYARDHHIRID